MIIGKIYGGDIYNVICEDVKLEGILRILNSKIRNFMIDKIVKIVGDIVFVFGCVGILYVSDENYFVVINEKELVDIVILNIKELFGEEKFILRLNLFLGGEDFFFYIEYCKGVFFYLGCKNEEKGLILFFYIFSFNIDEDCLLIGVMMYVMNILYFN